MQLSSREKIAVSIGGTSVVLFLLLQLFVFPMVESREKLQKSVMTHEQHLLEMQELQQQYAAFSKKNDSIAKVLEKRPAGFNLFAFLEKNAAESEVKEQIAYMKPSAVTENEFLQQSMVEMKLQAISIKQLVAFLERTESPQNLVGIKRLSIQENRKELGTLDATLQIISVDDMLAGRTVQ